ncbi:PREDICTED: LOW QUALITY PROTEIN: nucleoporin NUP188 homolog [Branchiostoma belcheri]|uniref:Nucleoporin NUP188 n=1 Tax=Branchiostoma belcheri TaxID=7741 RepID=A0A6P4YK57_BRABE|nr:PREDICTED: LOW QUALITY PROTEIN: nucleoporin NUP188 homolog [Branchiostoma belcheri]
MAALVGSGRELWQIITGQSFLRSQDQIGAELQKNKLRLLNGLLFYKPPSDASAKSLKEKKDVKKEVKDLTIRTSKFLGLDELQTNSLIELYLAQDFRESLDEWETKLSDERYAQTLLGRLADIYYEDRIYILQSIKHLLSYSTDDKHPYKEKYDDCLQMFGDQLINKVIEQYKKVFSREAPSAETHGNTMCELLEIVFLYYKEYEMHPTRLLEFARLFKSQGFGCRQTNKHHFSPGAEVFVTRLGFLSSLILIEGLDLEYLQETPASAVPHHPIPQDQDTFRALDRLITGWGDNPHHAPVLLGWAALRFVALPDDTSPTTRKLGSAALNIGVFQYLAGLLNTEPFSGQTVLAGVARLIVRGLLSTVLSMFHEDTLGGIHDLISVVTPVLEQKQLCRLFWESDQTSGLGVLLQSACSRFPLEFSPLLKLLTALAVDRETTDRVYEFMSCLPGYTELLEENKPGDIQGSASGTIWTLLRHKGLYRTSAGLVIPAGTQGEIINTQGPPVVRWEYNFNGWTLCSCELDNFLQYSAGGFDAASKQLAVRVTEVAELLNKMLSFDKSLAETLQPVTAKLYPIIQRLGAATNPPIDVVASCVQCLATLAQYKPDKVWLDLQQTGFLPFAGSSHMDVNRALSGSGMFAGNYGNLLMSLERPSGYYPVTIATLKLLLALAKGLQFQEGIIPAVVFVLKEVFASFYKWNYSNLKDRQEIGRRCLEIFHYILFVSEGKEETMEHDSKDTRLTLRDVCVSGLLYTEAGHSVLEILATGVENINNVVKLQASAFEGPGQDLIQMVKLAFSVVNRLLLLKPADGETTSPLEQALTYHAGGAQQGKHLVSVIAQYVYHRHDVRLTRLATLMLKRLSQVAPMSVHACLGDQAIPIRDMYLTRLQAKTEDLRLKVVILEWLTVAVETQPGLTELFLNLQTKEGKQGVKEFTVGKNSCLQAAVDMIEAKKQGTYLCPPDLHCAAVLPTCPVAGQERWSSVCTQGQKDLPSIHTNPQVATGQLKTCAHVMNIMAMEVHSIGSSSPDKELKKCLKDFAEKKRFIHWSEYLTSLVDHLCEEEGPVDPAHLRENPYLVFLSACRVVLLVAASQETAMHLADKNIKVKIIQNILTGITTLVSHLDSVLTVKAATMLTGLYVALLPHWKGSLQPLSQLEKLVPILEDVVGNSQPLEKIKTPLLSAILTLLKVKGEDSITEDTELVSRLLSVVCTVVQEATIYKPPQPTESGKTSGTNGQGENNDTANGDAAAMAAKKDTYSLENQSVCVLEALCSVPEVWLEAMRRHCLLQALLATVETCLNSRRNLAFVETAMQLFLTTAKEPKAAFVLAGSGVTQHLCIPLSTTYQSPQDLSGTVLSSINGSEKSLDAPSWPGVYRMALDLEALLLGTLKHDFLSDALDFVGVHQDRMLQCLFAVRSNLSPACLLEVEKTSLFLFQLVHHSREWQFHLPQLHQAMKEAVCHLVHTCAALLSRPRLLDHMVQSNTKQPRGTPQRQTSVTRTLRHSSSSDDVDKPSQELLQVQGRLLRILGNSLSMLRHLTPNLCEILLDQAMDVSEYPLMFALAFGSPTVDQDSPPSLGTLLACVNLGLRLLVKVEPSRVTSPVKSPAGPAPVQKPVVLYILENSLLVLMSQAARYLREPGIPVRDKQLMKRELSTELGTFLLSLQRYIKRGAPPSPGASTLPSPQQFQRGATPRMAFGSSQEHAFFQLVNTFMKRVLR